MHVSVEWDRYGACFEVLPQGGFGVTEEILRNLCELVV